MGIINATPDSFFAHSSLEEVESLSLQMQEADILDIGGESTRPDSRPVSEEEELSRVLPVIERLKSLGRAPLSIDTSKPEVARKAVQAGCSIINDVTGFQDPRMQELAAESGSHLVVMHSRGTPQTMQQMTDYEEGIVDHLKYWFEERIALLLKKGVLREKIILDPGIGFAKTALQNLAILKGISTLKALGFPLLIGLSRKSFLDKMTGEKSPLWATLAAGQYALLAGADILRVHDVKEHRKLIDLLKAIG